jgi:hypothetical protein
MRLSLVLTPLCLTIACARPDYAETWPDRFSLSAGAQPGYGIKRIIEKQAPETLIAEDGSVCRIAPERFARSKVGRWISCVWNLPTLDSTLVSAIRAGQ